LDIIGRPVWETTLQGLTKSPYQGRYLIDTTGTGQVKRVKKKKDEKMGMSVSQVLARRGGKEYKQLRTIQKKKKGGRKGGAPSTSFRLEQKKREATKSEKGSKQYP